MKISALVEDLNLHSLLRGVKDGYLSGGNH